MPKSPFGYCGGKFYLRHKIINHFPPHHTYVEPFGGGASVLLSKNSSRVEVYNDLDCQLVNFFRVLQDEEKFKEFYRLVSLTPYSRQVYNDFRCVVKETEIKDSIYIAYRFFIVARMSFSGIVGNSWRFSVTSTNRGMSSEVSKYLSSIESLPAVVEKLKRVQIENYDFRRIFEIYDTTDTLFYCDPPYVAQTRKRGKVYKHEMVDSDHADLVDILLKAKGMVVLSGYNNDIYNCLEKAGWKIEKTVIPCAAKGRTGKYRGKKLTEVDYREDCLWISPNCYKKQEQVMFAF